MFNIGAAIAVIGLGLRGLPNLGLTGSCVIVVGGVLMLLGAVGIAG